MSERDDPQKGDLILSGNRSLAIKRLDLVKRGLGLVQELKKRQLEVVIGDWQSSGIIEVITNFVEAVIENKYDLKVSSFYYADELLELADKKSFDILILVINNIGFRSNYPIQERWEYILQLITQIKTTYRRPVIALSGWLEDSSLIERTKLTADFFFPLPFKGDAFCEAIEKCLEMLPGFDEIHRNEKISKISEV